MLSDNDAGSERFDSERMSAISFIIAAQKLKGMRVWGDKNATGTTL